MADERGRFDWVVALAKVALAVSIILLLAILAEIVRRAALAYADTNQLSAIYPFIVPAAAVLIAMPWLVVSFGMVLVWVANEQSNATSAGRLARVETLLDQLVQNSSRLIDLASLTDQAKRLVCREQEAQALSEAVHHDLARQDFEAAQRRIGEMAALPGFAEEAQRLADAVAATRRATHEEQIEAAVARVQEVIDRRDWARAAREARELTQRYPQEPKVRELPARVEAARNQHKRELLQQYGEAVRKQDIDRGIALLRELDGYLSPQEGAALAESARGVFRAKLHNLGVQFAICVTDQRWAQAVATGEEIIRGYPNTRMAQEVREKMELLRARAAQKAKQA